MANDFFNDLGESLSKRAQGLGEKFGSVYELQKIRNQIAGEEKIIEKTMADIGRIVYNQYKDGETVSDGFADLCEVIQSHEKRIDALQQKIADRKGKKICPQCKKSVDIYYSYCPFCGSAVPEAEPECESEEETVEEEVPVTEEPEKVSGEVVNNEDIEDDAPENKEEEVSEEEEKEPSEEKEEEKEEESVSEE